MASSAKILLTFSTRRLCLVGDAVLICKVDDFQIGKPLQRPQPQWFVSSVNMSTTFPPAKVSSFLLLPLNRYYLES